MKKMTFTCLLYIIMIIGITGCNNNFDSLKGTWIANTDDQIILQINGDGDTIGGNEDYILECDGKGNYTITLDNDQTKSGTYIIEKDKNITFKDESNLLLGTCRLSENNEIYCDETSMAYAFKYTKYNK